MSQWLQRRSKEGDIYNLKMTEKGNGTEVIKLAVQLYADAGFSPIVLFQEVTEWLWDSYQKTEDKNCLETADRIVQAYMELGLPYDNMKDLFDQILKEKGTSRQERFPKAVYSINQLKATPSQIRGVLGRWPKSNGKEPNADWVVKDMVDRIQNHKVGRQCYRRGMSDKVFELIVLEESAFLLDLERNRIFTF